VLTAGGIVGYIIDIDGDRVTLETSVGASFVVLKQYVLRKIEDPASGSTRTRTPPTTKPNDDERAGGRIHDEESDSTSPTPTTPDDEADTGPMSTGTRHRGTGIHPAGTAGVRKRRPRPTAMTTLALTDRRSSEHR
jgi:hypothetical protein